MSMCSEVVVPLANMISPCTIKDTTQEVILGASSALTHKGPDNLGLLLCPVFAYKRGGVWQAENHIVSRLVNKGLHLDRSFSVIFKGRADPREADFCRSVRREALSRAQRHASDST